MNAWQDIVLTHPDFGTDNSADHESDSGASSGVLLITLNRPQARNALRTALLAELAAALADADQDSAVRCVVISGGRQVFAAGADIREMAAADPSGALLRARQNHWQVIQQFQKPMIAAVNGCALGGGCELAMSADLIIAADNACFGQPEVNLGTIPGAGGTQRLIRAVGKSLAAKMILGGEPICASDALSAGLVAELTTPDQTLKRAIGLAKTIASKSPLAVRSAKKLLHTAQQAGLDEGLEREREVFALLAASADREEGIRAFLEKRPAVF